MNILITAGPTREFFDPVRFISNPSSGKMGYALACAAAAAVAGSTATGNTKNTVTLVSGPVALEPPAGVTLHRVVTGAEMLECTGALFENCDILIMTAAVCDFRPKHYAAGKVKKENVPLTAEFERVPDILKTLAARRHTAQTLVGFAAETENIEQHAREKLTAKHVDLIVANKVARAEGTGNAFGSDENTVVLIGTGDFRLPFGPAPKPEIARWLIEQITRHHRSR